MIPVGAFSYADLAPVLDKWTERVDAGDHEIWFRISSFGGDMFAGMDLIQRIQDDKREHGIVTVCVADNWTISMGFTFLQGACDVRLMTAHTILLAHNGSGGAKGTVEQMLESVEILKALNEAIGTMECTRLTISCDEYFAKIAKYAWTMAAAEAKEVGAVDAIIALKDLPRIYTLAPVRHEIEIEL